MAWHVYLDDVLVTACSRSMAACVIRKAAAALRDAGFIINPKLEKEPTTEITFLGKRLDSVGRSITNTSGMLMATIRFWKRASAAGGQRRGKWRACWVVCSGWAGQCPGRRLSWPDATVRCMQAWRSSRDR